MAPAESHWKQPAQDILDVLHAAKLPKVWTSPTGSFLLLADPVSYPPLATLAAPMHALAGIRVDPTVNGFHGSKGATSPRLVAVDGGKETPLALPEGVQVSSVSWTADGQNFALTVRHSDHIGVWVGSVSGELDEIEGVAINLLLGGGVRWLPDQPPIKRS